MKIKNILLICTAITTSCFSFANSKYPYSQFKEVEFFNPTLTNEFENFISQMHKQDLEFEAELETAMTKYTKKYEREKRMVAYKSDSEQKKRLGTLTLREEKTFNNLSNKFISKEVALFNGFVKRMQNNPKLTHDEKMGFIKAIQPIHKAYKDAFDGFKGFQDMKKSQCFVDEKDVQSVYFGCEFMYNDLVKQYEGLKFHTSIYMNEFITKYKVSTTAPNSLDNLRVKIEEIQRMESFKWE